MVEPHLKFEFQGINGLKTEEKQHRSFKYLLQRIWSYKGIGIAITVLGVFVSLSQVSTIAMVRPVLDILFENNPETVVTGLTGLSDSFKMELLEFVKTHVLPDRMKWLKIFCLLILVMGLVNLFLNITHRFLARMLSQRFQIELYRELYSHLLTLSMPNITSRKQGDMASRFSHDTKMMQEAVHEFFQILLKEPFTVIFMLGTCFFLNWEVTLYALVIFPIVGVIIATLSRRLRKLSVTESETAGGLLHQVSESISGFHVIKVFQSEKFLLGKLTHSCNKYLNTMKKIIRIEAITSPTLEFLGVIAIVGILLAMAPLVNAGKISVGSLLAILVALFSAYKPIKSFSNAIQKLSRSLGACDRFMEIKRARSETQGGVKTFPDHLKELRFEQVEFSYQVEPVLKGIDFVVEQGQTVAIVGSTGAGKSTIMQLIPRFYDPTRGTIKLNDCPLDEYNVQSLREKMAFVSQNVFLFNDSIKNNITMGLEYPMEDIQKAARAAHAEGFIEKSEKGYDTRVGDRGVLLSGGQCQRIALARAFLKNPPLLLLDEATSALDAETEKVVQKSIEELSRHRTTLIVAHRLTTILNADKILVMEHGKVIEEGTHQQLLEKGGLYTRLYANSFGEVTPS